MVNGLYVLETKTKDRIQLGLGPSIPWIEYTMGNQFLIKRYAGELPVDQVYIDISDSPPDQMPSSRGVSLSIYCDPGGFMEMETCGGCPAELTSGTELSVRIITEYEII